jgi:hypothetical protein
MKSMKQLFQIIMTITLNIVATALFAQTIYFDDSNTTGVEDGTE